MLIVLDLIGFVLVLLLSLYSLRNLTVSASAWLDPIPITSSEIPAYSYLVVIGLLYLIAAIWHTLQIISYYKHPRRVLQWLGNLILTGQTIVGLVVLALLHSPLNLPSTFRIFVQATGWLAYVNLLLLLLWIVRRWLVHNAPVSN